jgi:hypothetical protein
MSSLVGLVAEIKPLDIIGFLFELVFAAAGIALVIGLLVLLFEPIYALLTRKNCLRSQRRFGSGSSLWAR